MIVKLNVQLDLPNHLRTNNIGSVLHGVLIELLPEETAEQLHQLSSYNPLKQRILFTKEEADWEIVSLLPDLGEQVIQIFGQRKEIFLKRHNVSVNVKKVAIERFEVGQMIKDVFSKDDLTHFINIRVCSPMSFKSEGQYDIFPDIKKFFRSIMLTFDSFFSEYQMYDRDTLEYLADQVKIVSYQLRSTKFHLEGISIPSFSGLITFRVRGPQTFVQLVHFLIAFGEFSGVGIKTSLGMGKYKIV